ncbi:peptide deformylase [Phaeobacter sp.]|uniref:peptide deformylase n=1 Tax=Phaeobacter sp. TaxID=1902409 RepID=UPI0025E71E18|nr:peptide deformylase [Phaeobacter sp.]
MAVLQIVAWPDPVLSAVAEPATDVSEIADLAADMLETMYSAPGRGLAAPQVGHSLRLFVMDTTWKDEERTPMVFINPEILDRSSMMTVGPEGCLSIKGVSLDVERSDWVDVAWTTLQGERRTQRFDGFDAICIQHENDHLDGLVTFDRVSAAVRKEVEAAYHLLLETTK